MPELNPPQRNQLQAIEEALYSYPLAPVPEGLLETVMARIQSMDEVHEPISSGLRSDENAPQADQAQSDQQAAIEDGLRTYQLVPPPEGLLQAVMENLLPLETTPVGSPEVAPRPPAPPFRLAWLDYALSLFAACMVSLVLMLSPALPIPPDWSARLRLALLYAWQCLRFDPILQGELLMSAAIFSALLVLLALRVLWLQARKKLTI